MTGDYSRQGFEPRDHDAAVFLQQGRVLTDEDWNLHVRTADRRTRTEAVDVIGLSGVPSITPDGFKIGLTGGSLTIGLGRMYVDGHLAENHGRPAFVWRAHLEDLVGTLSFTYPTQPHLPAPPPLPAGRMLVYLKVCRRELTAVDDPELIEPALGIDTTTRWRTVWQVKAVPVPGSYVPGSPFGALPAFVTEEPRAGGRLTVGTTTVEVDPNPCQIAPTGGYTGVENQLYRVEIHRPGPPGTATFKWSRDNATVAARVESIPATLDRVVVDRLGPDDVLSFHDGDWVELIDDARELARQPGVLRRIRSGGGVDEATRTVLLAAPLGAGDVALDAQGRPVDGSNLRMRRWDQGSALVDETGVAVTDPALAGGTITVPAGGTRLVLEHGITVEFSTDAGDGVFRTGDHWLIPARTADPTGHESAARPPDGIHAHYAGLAVVDGGTVTDVRPLFPPLSGLDSLYYVAGDGQEVMPNTLAPAPVPLPVNPTVGVARGPIPLAGRSVRFSLLTGGSARINGGTAPVIVPTGSDGTAGVAWAVDPSLDQQALEARLLDVSGAPVGLPVRFSARTRRAATVSYEPGACSDLTGVRTVQEALDTLCLRGGGGDDRAECCASVGEGGDYDTLAQAIGGEASRHDGRVCVCLLPGDHVYDGNDIDFVTSLDIHGCRAVLRLDRPLRVMKARDVHFSELTIIGPEDRLGHLIGFFGVTLVTLTALVVGKESGFVDTLVMFNECQNVRVRDCEMIAPDEPRDDGDLRFSGPVRNLIAAAANGDELELRNAVAAIKRSAIARREVVAAQLDEFAASGDGAADPELAAASAELAGLVRAGGEPEEFLARAGHLSMLAAFLGDVKGIPRSAITIDNPRGPVWLSGNDLVGGLSLYGTRDPERVVELTDALDELIERAREPFPIDQGPGRLDVQQNRLAWVLLGRDAESVESAFRTLRFGENVVDGGVVELLAGHVTASGNDLGARGRLLGVVYAVRATLTANIALPERKPILVMSVPNTEWVEAANLNVTFAP